MGVFGGLAVGPLLGEAVLGTRDYDAVWFVAAALAGFAALLATGTRDTERAAAADARQADQPHGGRARDRCCSSGLIALAAFNSFVPLYVDDVGLDGADGIFFLYGVLCSWSGSSVRASRIATAADRTGALALACNAAGMAVDRRRGRPRPASSSGPCVFALGMSLLYPALLPARAQRCPRERSAPRPSARSASSSTCRRGSVRSSSAVSRPSRDSQGAFTAGGVSALVGLRRDARVRGAARGRSRRHRA